MIYRYYLAYGSNLNINIMKLRCNSAKLIETLYLNDYRLMFKGTNNFSYLTIEPYKNSLVPLALYRINFIDEKRLDKCEGFPYFYHKEYLNIDDKVCYFYVIVNGNIRM